MTPFRIAKNDGLIETLIADPNYFIYANGTIYRLSHGVWKQTGQAKTFKRGKTYRHLKYQGQNLLVHRIVYRRHVGHLDTALVVNHIDGNSLNNDISNLELVTQQINRLHWCPSWQAEAK